MPQLDTRVIFVNHLSEFLIEHFDLFVGQQARAHKIPILVKEFQVDISHYPPIIPCVFSGQEWRTFKRLAFQGVISGSHQTRFALASHSSSSITSERTIRLRT